MNCLLVPTLALDDASLIERLALSVDFPIKHKIVINNGRGNSLDSFQKRHSDWTVLHYGGNLGCSGSWNLFPRLFPNEDACLIVNDDEEFQPGCLERICRASDEQSKNVSILYVNPHESLGYFVWTKRGADRFGLFDENFWPAYREDWDMKARFKIGGADHFIIGNMLFPVKHGKPFPCSPEYHAVLDAIWAIDGDYFIRKWGRLDDWHSWGTNSPLLKDGKPFGSTGPLFSTPFNNPRLSIKDWTLDKRVREKREAIWDAFWNKPTFSIYK